MAACTSGQRRATLRLLAWPWLALLPVLPVAALAQGDAATLERRVKAAFLYKFVGYIAWPETALAQHDTPVVIAVMGDDALAAELAEVVNGRTMDGRPLAVRRLRDGEPLAGIHVLFLARKENARLPALARASSGLPLVLVSEAEGALDQGSTINFVVTDGRVKFDIAPDAAEKRGVKLSSRLLTVAQRVRPANVQ